MKNIIVKIKAKTFTERVKDVVRDIPKGKTMSYADVAKYAGSPGASRAVGSIMKGNYDPKIPCHRVIRSDGKVGEYNRGGSAKKLALLKKEGWGYN
ncbi:MAG: methylated-DNA--[protein]-cysteine S-methyltransferase [Parcubacteria bacterium C7867-003]|nr:MAG: methylated-DNA--[protein]-cysteine S-methyltransferase [Parcubacteria bacterium C7867-003]